MPTLEGVKNGKEYCFSHGFKKIGCPGCREEMIKKLENYSKHDCTTREKDILISIIMLYEIYKTDSTKCPECEIGDLIKNEGMFCSLCSYKFSINA